MRPIHWLATGLTVVIVAGVATAWFIFGSPSAPPMPAAAELSPSSASPLQSLVPALSEVDPAEIIWVLPKDAIPAITNPRFLSAAEGRLRPGELVLGFILNGEARAYPISVLNWHEIVDDVVGGVPVAVTYCPLCGTGIVFDRQVGDQVLVFKVSGKLFRNDLVMYDTKTQSYWTQIWGGAIHGPLKGTRLRVLSSSLTTWAKWQSSYPESLVLSRETGYVRDYETNPYAGYEVSAGTLFPRARTDNRLFPKEFILGMNISGAARAYPFRVLANLSVVNDQLGGVPLVVVFDPDSSLAKAFTRMVHGRLLTFLRARPGFFTDLETRSTWRIVDGMAVDGPLKGQQLTEFPAVIGFWFAWVDFNTATEIYRPAP